MSKKSDSSLKDNQKNQRIQVFARTRPLNGSETKQHSRNVLEVCPEKKEVRVRDGKMINKAFAFDRVFGPETSQIHVYQAVVGPLIQEVLMGYNCTVFAYGQTSTGKTFTMEGERSDKTCTWEEDPKAGIIPRSLHQLFEELYKEESVEFSVHVSFLELYNEELFDLLSPNDVQIVKLRLFEDSSRKGSVVIQGLEEIKVNSKDEVYAILERGTVRRQTAATHLNASSSRSHTVFSVTVHIKENTIDGEELLKTGKLNLVDLAGSENIGRSGASQKTAREAGNINQSLLTLGRVITALVEKAPHIPYRESKLTRLLQDSLGGHTKTSIIATVSPASCNIEETISTLDYAQRAKSITIKPEVNQKMTKKALIKEYTEEIERLRKDVMAARDNNLGVFIHRDNYQAMEELKESYANAIIKNKELFDNLAETQNILEDTKVELNATTNKYNERTTECEKLKEKLSEVLEALKLTQQARDAAVVKRDENQYIIDVRKEIENKLTHQAQALLQVADESTKNLSATFDVIDRKKCVDETNNERSRDFEVKFQHKLEVMNGIIAQMAVEQSNNLNSVEEDIGAVLESCEKYYSTFRNSLIEDFEKEFLYQAKTTTEFFSSNAEEHMMFCDNNASKVADLQLHNKALADGLKLLREKHSLMREGWTSLMTNLTQLLLTFRMQTKTKLQELEVRTQSSALSHKQLTNDLAAMLKESSSKHLEQLQWCIDQISLNTTKNQEFDKKREENFEIMLNALTTIQTLNKEKDQISNKQAIQCSDALSQIIENIKITCLEHSRKVDVSNEETDMKNTELLALHQDLYKTYENQEEQVKEECVSMSTEQIKIIDETMTICQSHQDVLNTQDQVIEDVCELTVKEKTNLEENKKKYLQHVDEAKTVADGQISDIKLHVKVQEEHIVSRFNGQLGLVSKSRKRLLESTGTLKNECSDCGTQMKKFLEEDLQKDISSGNTPKRKCYIISHELAATSPHEKLLERRRLQLDLSNETSTTKNGRLDSSSDNSSTSPLLLRRTQSSKESLSVIDNDSSSGEESPAAYSDTYSSQSDLTSDSTKNKENQHLSKKSKIPKKRSPRKGLTKPQPLVRKPLSSSNVTLHE